MLCTSSCDDRLVRHVRAIACRLRAVVSRRAAVEGFESDSKRDAAAASFLMVMQQRQLKVRILSFSAMVQQRQQHLQHPKDVHPVDVGSGSTPPPPLPLGKADQ